jgi:hypothetical protein
VRDLSLWSSGLLLLKAIGTNYSLVANSFQALPDLRMLCDISMSWRVAWIGEQLGSNVRADVIGDPR